MQEKMMFIYRKMWQNIPQTTIITNLCRFSHLYSYFLKTSKRSITKSHILKINKNAPEQNPGHFLSHIGIFYKSLP